MGNCNSTFAKRCCKKVYILIDENGNVSVNSKAAKLWIQYDDYVITVFIINPFDLSLLSLTKSIAVTEGNTINGHFF